MDFASEKPQGNIVRIVPALMSSKQPSRPLVVFRIPDGKGHVTLQQRPPSAAPAAQQNPPICLQPVRKKLSLSLGKNVRQDPQLIAAREVMKHAEKRIIHPEFASSLLERNENRKNESVLLLGDSSSGMTEHSEDVPETPLLSSPPISSKKRRHESPLPRSSKVRKLLLHERKDHTLLLLKDTKTNPAYEKVHLIMPWDDDYIITSVNHRADLHKPDHDTNSLSDCFTAVIRLPLHSKEEGQKWLGEFMEVNRIDLRVRKTFYTKKKSERVVFKKVYRCHCNTGASNPKSKTKKPHAKHVNCKASVTVTIKDKNMKWSADDMLQEYPCEVTVNHLHEHIIIAADALRHRRPKSAVQEKFHNMFAKGHSPSSALETHKFDLQEEYGDEYLEVSADGAECPKMVWCYYQYCKIFKEKYGSPEGEEMVISLKKFVDEYNAASGSECAKVLNYDKDLIVAVCSPMMKRCHESLPTAAEIMFADSSGTMDTHNTRVFSLATSSVAGALPLGIIMTFSESKESITQGLDLWKSLLPEGAFFGRGKNDGPKIIMTDDSFSERNSFGNSFKESILLLCKFHVLQAFWRYVWDSKHQVLLHEKPQVYNIFKQIVNAETVQDFEELFQKAMDNPVLSKYEAVKNHMMTLKEREQEWAMCHRTDLLTRGNNTNNYDEAVFRILKDIVLRRTKAFSIVQLFDFLVTRLEAYFQRRITAVINNRQEYFYKSRYFIKPEKLIPLECSKLSEDVYEVHNKQSRGNYVVNVSIEVCSCPIGLNGAPCKHQLAVVKKFKLSSNQFLPFQDKRVKMALHYIITGSKNCPEGWFDTLRGDAVVSPSILPVFAEVAVDSVQLEVTSQEGVHDDNNKSQHELEERCSEDLDALICNLKTKLHSRPDVFIPACQNFIKNFNDCKSESRLVSALCTFANSTESTPLRRGGKIPVQSTAVARRTTYLGGRQPQYSGRPAKSTYASEHGYNKVKSNEPRWFAPPARSKAAPHSLEACVAVPCALGKTHCKK